MGDILSTRGDYVVSANSTKISSAPTTYLAEVTKVFLSLEKDSNGNNIIPGSITVKSLGANNKSIAKTIFPLDENILTLPMVGELVEVFNDTNIPYYRRFNFNDSIQSSLTKGKKGQKKSPLTDLNSFKSLALSGTGGIANSILGGTPVKRLKLYEGDTILQSRYGQSIRMSNSVGGGGDPVIIIRNGQAKGGLLGGIVGALTGGGGETEENINKDGSTIAISAGGYVSDFTPGKPLPVVGTTNFKMNPASGLSIPFLLNNKSYAFESIPKVLDGNQIIISSDRLVFSSRLNEMIFWSKGNYGVITDGVFSVDTYLGVNVNSKGNIDIQAPEKNITLYVGNSGKINLGDKDMQPVVKGIALKNILLEIITEIENLKAGGLLTPAGPVSGMNPEMSAKLIQIKANLDSILSTKVDVSA